jgi:hypothetical protein
MNTPPAGSTPANLPDFAGVKGDIPTPPQVASTATEFKPGEERDAHDVMRETQEKATGEANAAAEALNAAEAAKPTQAPPAVDPQAIMAHREKVRALAAGDVHASLILAVAELVRDIYGPGRNVEDGLVVIRTPHEPSVFAKSLANSIQGEFKPFVTLKEEVFFNRVVELIGSGETRFTPYELGQRAESNQQASDQTIDAVLDNVAIPQS